MQLNEQVNIQNILFLQESDVRFLKNFGLYLFNSFDGRFDDEIKEAKTRSYLFKVLNQQSVNALEMVKVAHIPNTTLAEGLKDTYIVEAYIQPEGEVMEDCSERRFIDQNVILYLPIMLEWLRNYGKTSKDSDKTKAVLKSIYYPIREAAKKKTLLLSGMGI